MESRKEEIRNWCLKRKEEQIALLCELAAIPSPSHKEDRRAAFILDWLNARGIPGAYLDEAKNVLLPLGIEGRDDIEVYCAHTDIVFPDTEPLPVRTENGRIYAPGVGDDTANAVALLLIAEYLKEHPQPVPMLLVWNSCEEGLGNLKGSRAICDAFSGRIRSFVSFDGEYSELVSRAVGCERWRVTARTKGGHSYGAFGNPNAIAELSELITRLYRQEVPHSDVYRTTYNVGTIAGGTTVNSIAQQAEMTYEYRSDDIAALAVMREQFKRLLQESRNGRAEWDLELIGERPCGSMENGEANTRLLMECEKAIVSVTGERPERIPLSTDCNIPLSRGIPATAFGLYLGYGPHTREEYVELDTLPIGLMIGLTLVTRPREN